MANIKEKVRELAKRYHEDIIKVRRHLHAYPELSFEEEETSSFIQKQLSEKGISFKSGVAGTGIVATIKGRNPDRKTIALRGDMDALPIMEENDVPYKSKHPGIMHACGHDVHTSSLLGALWILNELRDEFSGTIRGIFQPGEERMPGGASLMIKEGVLENPAPASILGQHVYPLLPAGTVGFKSGMFMASADEIDVRVIGKGGHGAVPHLAIDPVTITAQIITALQQVISRQADPTIPSVLTFGQMNTQGGTYNVIPNEVRLKGTFRTFSEYWRFQAHEKITETAKGIASSMGGRCEVDITVGYPFLVNNEELTERCKQHAIDYLGQEAVRDLPMRMTAEDFSYYTHHVHGCFYRLGVSNPEKGIKSPVHSPTFNIDEEALQLSIGLMSWLAINELSAT